MISNKTIDTLAEKTFSVFKTRRIFIVFNLLYFFYLLVCLFNESSDYLYNTILFYFDAHYSEFKLWFPKYHFWAYTFIVGIKGLTISFFASLLYLLYHLYKRRKLIFSYNNHKGYSSFIKHESTIALVALAFYLVLYFLSKTCVYPSLHESLQVLIGRGFLAHLILQSIIITSVHFERIIKYLKNYLLTPSLPHNLAILRILFFSYLILIYFGKYFSARPTVSLPEKTPLPYIGWLIDIIPVNPTLYGYFAVIGIACCLFIAIGYKTRWFLLLNAICVFYIIATPNFFGKLWHEQLIIWISWFFTFSRCYDVFSIDSKLSKKAIVKSADYTFPVRFVWLTFGIIYFWAGFYKLWDSGFDWALGDSMINQVQLEWAQNYDKVPDIRIDKYPLLLHIGGLSAILFELGYIFFILKPSYRWIAVTGGLLMHNIVGYFMYIPFRGHLQVFYIAYLDFGKWFTPKNLKPAIVKGYSKIAFTFGIIIMSVNFLCGMLSIDSYPFSAYPKYAVLISDTLKIVHFDAKLSDGTKLDIHKIGKQNNFRWESYGWLEHNLIRDFEKGKNVSSRLKDYWQIWENYNPELKECISVNAYVVERPVAPEGMNQLKTVSLIGKVKTNEELISP